jgi:mono/diheme cytochrome c family protein
MPAVASLLVGLALLSIAPSAVGAQDGRDLHDYWDGRCRECHGDAGDFARRTLAVDRGRLVGKHHRDDLEGFLTNHYLTDELVAPVMQMLTAQVTTRPLFKQHCAGCHGAATEFARESLVLRDGKAVGRKGGRAVVEYLRTHGGLAPADIPVMAATLERVLRETGAR